jgi:geranylgeranyl pyrophosphate synthase
VTEIVHDRGGVERAMERARAYGEAARAALAAVPSGAAQDTLRLAVAYVVDRRA